MTIAWPLQLRVRSSSFHPDVPSRSGGLSITGFEQVTVSNAGRWRASVTLPLHREHQVLAYRALISQMQGRVGTILVPHFQAYRPRDINGRKFSTSRAASYGENGSNFDLSGWGQEEYTHATLEIGAALGATQISLNLVSGEGPQPGHYFGIGERLYLAHAVWQETPTSPTQVRFWPRLREPATAGTRVILDRPVCRMRLADDGSGEVSFDLARFGDATLSFVEAV